MRLYPGSNNLNIIYTAFFVGILFTFLTPFVKNFNFYWFLAVFFFVIIYWVGFIIRVNRSFKSFLIDKEKKIYENVVKIIRVIRHDFINHLQIIQSLAELNQQEKINDYLLTVNSETNKMGGILKLAYPELTLFFMDQLAKYKKRGIDFEFNNETNMEKIKDSPDNIVFMLRSICERIESLTKMKNDILASIGWEITVKKNTYRIKIKVLTLHGNSEHFKEELQDLKKDFNLEVYSFREQLEVYLYIVIEL